MMVSGPPEAQAEECFNELEQLELVSDIEIYWASLCGGSCKTFVLIAESGSRFPVCLGISENQVHGGFWCGAGTPNSSEAVPVPHGSNAESNIVFLVESYVALRYPDIVIAFTNGDFDFKNSTYEETGALYLLRYIEQFRHQQEIMDSLFTSYSYSEIEAIAQSNYYDLSPELQPVFDLICEMRGGGIAYGARDEHLEVGGDTISQKKRTCW
jgi:hypothetical protein